LVEQLLERLSRLETALAERGAQIGCHFAPSMRKRRRLFSDRTVFPMQWPALPAHQQLGHPE
jgi:hypothetical protein